MMAGHTLSPFAGAFNGPNTTVLLVGPQGATRTALARHLAATHTDGGSGGCGVSRCHMVEELPLDVEPAGEPPCRPTMDCVVLLAFGSSADSMALAHENMAHLGAEYLQGR